MIDGTRIGLDIAARPALRKLRRAGYAVPKSDSDADILDFVRRAGRTCFHPVGTCAMGTVVDAELRVHGVESLRVVDASVMPTIPRGNTNAPTIMIAEKAADLIRGLPPLPTRSLHQPAADCSLTHNDHPAVQDWRCPAHNDRAAGLLPGNSHRRRTDEPDVRSSPTRDLRSRREGEVTALERRTSAFNPGPTDSARSEWRPNASRATRRASSDDAGPLTPALLLRQERGHQARADAGFRSGRRLFHKGGPSAAFNTISVCRRTSLRAVVSRGFCCRRTCGSGWRRITWRGS